MRGNNQAGAGARDASRCDDAKGEGLDGVNGREGRLQQQVVLPMLLRQLAQVVVQPAAACAPASSVRKTTRSERHMRSLAGMKESKGGDAHSSRSKMHGAPSQCMHTRSPHRLNPVHAA